ncbi:MAG: hypothetical protein HYV77_01375 [Candidatus Wildermuthbacteria bacterium]|nr:hypothetical protein [Candidatus Wildermuthbacteria bacterium]
MANRTSFSLSGKNEYVESEGANCIPIGWVFFFEKNQLKEKTEGSEHFYYENNADSAISLAESRLDKLEKQDPYFKKVFEGVRELIEAFKKVEGREKVTLDCREFAMFGGNATETIKIMPEQLDYIINRGKQYKKKFKFFTTEVSKIEDFNKFFVRLGLTGKLTGNTEDPIALSKRDMRQWLAYDATSNHKIKYEDVCKSDIVGSFSEDKRLGFEIRKRQKPEQTNQILE